MMPEERIPKLIMEWILQERSKRGRPRKTRMEGVQSAMTIRNLELDQRRKGGMAFGFQKKATAVIKPDRKIDR
jgi:ribosomal protein L14